LPWLILAGRFLDDVQQMVDRWATWATEVVESWPDDITRAEPDLDALESMAVNQEALLARARARSEDVSQRP
jgi:hypothetical protein